LSFNDDIQGTGAVALAGLLSALRTTGDTLQSQRVLIYGAGAAGLGIARQIKAAMVESGLTSQDAQQHIAVLDSRGLLVDDRKFRDPYKRELAWTTEFAADIGLQSPGKRGLMNVVKAFQPSMLVGSSGQAQAFTQEIIQSMAENVQRPLVMPFSNPTDRSEATPEDIIHWTKGRALIATGSPFPNVQYKDNEYQIGQGNNVFIFPGLGLGAMVSGATRITDTMVSAAANALANSVSEQELTLGLLFPAVDRLRQVSREVAIAVAQQATKDNVATISTQNLEAEIENSMWQPNYQTYTRS
jgi:malate dehydrogenase (oxaloacetate-decarboxylating)